MSTLTSHPAGFGEVLANRHYRNILIAQFVSNVGSWMELIAMQLFVVAMGGGLDDMGVLGACQLTPILVFGTAGGVVSDRVDRKRLLFVTQLLMGAVAAGVAVVAGLTFEVPRNAINWVFVLGAAHGIVMAFNMPAWQVLTPRLVPREQLTRAVTLNGIQFNLARVIGPALAGFLLPVTGSVPLFVFNAVSFFGVALTVLTTPPAPAPPANGVSPWGQVVEASRFIAEHRGMRAIFFAQVLISFLAAPLVRLLSLFTKNVYGLSVEGAERTTSVLLACQGVGAVIGGLALRFIPAWYPKHHFIPVAVTGLAVTICLFSMVTTPVLGYSAMTVCGFFWIWAFNQSWAAAQVIAPDAMRGRVLSLITVFGFGATALGVYAAGHLGQELIDRGVLDPRPATQLSLGVLGVPLLLAGIVMMLVRVPEVDNLPRNTPRKFSLSLLEAVTASQHRPDKRVAVLPEQDPGTTA